MDAKELVNKLHWLGHDSFRLDGPPVVYFDPWKLKDGLPTADLVLVSHEHADHCSPDDVKKISGPDTVVVASVTAAEKLPGAKIVRPGDRVTVSGVEIEAVRAYNVNKFRSPGVPFHPPEAEHVGFVVTLDGVRVYFAGDTDHIPEMVDIACDVALLPVSGKYVMTVEESAEAARTLSPQIVVPMHYGAGIGTAGDGRHFTELYSGQVSLLAVE
ncbi:MAG: MBL fold metallo-hydrolase [Anaerolineae bacterium]|jgi:L-ascorbate metabolism protein UlaG (beta-lactamase superfamily)